MQLFLFGKQMLAFCKEEPENTHAGHILGDHCRPGRACDTPMEHQHEQQVKPDIQQRRHGQKHQRDGGIAQRPQQAGKVIVQGGRQQPGEDNEQVFPHSGGDAFRYLQKSQDRFQKEIDRRVQHQRDAQDQSESVNDAQPKRTFIASAPVNGKKRPGTHAQPEKNGGQEGHQRIGGAYGGQRFGTQRPADDQRIGNVIKLLQQIACDHGQRKEKQRAGDASPRQVAVHGGRPPVDWNGASIAPKLTKCNL